MTGYIVAVILAALWAASDRRPVFRRPADGEVIAELIADLMSIASMLDDVGSGRSAEYVRGMADRVRMLRSDRTLSEGGAS